MMALPRKWYWDVCSCEVDVSAFGDGWLGRVSWMGLCFAKVGTEPACLRDSSSISVSKTLPPALTMSRCREK